MKKTSFTFMLFLIISHAGKSQINLSNSVFPAIGTTWISFQDNRTGVHTITPASGSAQTWNYANAFVVDDTTFTSWKNPSATPYASNFPQATHVFTRMVFMTGSNHLLQICLTSTLTYWLFQYLLLITVQEITTHVLN